MKGGPLRGHFSENRGAAAPNFILHPSAFILI
jgi:hypothetical protein